MAKVNMSRLKQFAALSLITFFGSQTEASLVVTTSVGHRVKSDGAILLRTSEADQNADNSIHLPRGIVTGIHNLALKKGQC